MTSDVLLNEILNDNLPSNFRYLIHFEKKSTREKNRKIHEFICLEMDDIFEQLENYMRQLPAPTKQLTVPDRILVLNCRGRFTSISIVFDDAIRKLYTITKEKIRAEERIMKPESDLSTLQTMLMKAAKRAKQITLPEVNPPVTAKTTLNYNVRKLLYGNETIWETFGDELRDTEELPQVPREATMHDEDFQDEMSRLLNVTLGPVLKDELAHETQPEITGSQSEIIREIYVNVPSQEEDELAHDTQPQITGSQSEIIRRMDVNVPGQEEIPKEHVPEESATKKKKGEGTLNRYDRNPQMSTAEYSKFLKKVKLPTTSEDIFNFMKKKGYCVKEEDDEWEKDKYEADWGVELKTQDFPRYTGFRLRVLPPSADPGEIPEFELLTEELTTDKEPIITEGPITDLLLGTQGLEEVPSALLEPEAVPTTERWLNSYLQIEDGQLDMQVVHNLPEPTYTESHLLDTTSYNSKKFEEQTFLSIYELCNRQDDFTIKFTDICNLSQNRLIASRFFVAMMRLYGQQKVYVYQTSTRPCDIFIKCINQTAQI